MKRSIVSPGFVKRTLAKLLKLDQQLGIVVDGNVASQAIAVGNYVNLINSTITGKTDGIYVATGAVSSGGTVTASDISGNALAKGISNELSEQIGNLSLGTITPATGVTITDSICRKSIKTVTVAGTFTWVTGEASWKTLGTLPTGFRPSQQIRFIGNDNTNSFPCLIQIGTTGTIESYPLKGSGTTSKISQFTISFVVS